MPVDTRTDVLAGKTIADGALLERRGLRTLGSLMARETGDFAEARLPFRRLVIGEELLIQHLRHLEHPSCDGLPRVRFSGKVATRVTEAA